ncbi:MAG: transcriptional regulator [Chloroflexi bacterium AL-W]|nr:transcriptional regulator [Chloroflexi bacterium AL-N1]NOK68553.1 transcriptional regulator [Chloroflexi bacterium AL-N10]NOK76039.1 transcriptional regulator [Chloroflexi bacterium AL-N5]NOK82510.1 transcriptional regulator [Chloroflexi bacterium AL-W]NOK92822.1 transcriptional regulator [Chloroflexi bacterium AL-N15]
MAIDEDNLQQVLNIERIVHEPVRLVVMVILFSVESADFLYLLRATGQTKGNISSHMTKLEMAGYVEVEKKFRGKVPMTLYTLTDEGHQAL